MKPRCASEAGEGKCPCSSRLSYFPQVADRIWAYFPGRPGRLGFAWRFSVYQALGFVLPLLHQLLRLPIVSDGMPQDGGLLGRDRPMDELAAFHMSPLIVWAVAGVGILGAAAALLAADLHALQERAGTQIVDRIERLPDALDALAGLLDDDFGSVWHELDF